MKLKSDQMLVLISPWTLQLKLDIDRWFILTLAGHSNPGQVLNHQLVPLLTIVIGDAIKLNLSTISVGSFQGLELDPTRMLVEKEEARKSQCRHKDCKGLLSDGEDYSHL